MTYNIAVTYCEFGSVSDAIKRLRDSNIDSVTFELKRKTAKITKFHGKYLLLYPGIEPRYFKPYISNPDGAENQIKNFLKTL